MRNYWLRSVALALLVVLAACSAPSENLLDPQIVGGAEALPGQFPFAVHFTSASGGCTGSVINDSWALTAKHCVAGASLASMRVVAGEHRRSLNDSTEQVRRVTRVVEHPNRDLALLRLDRALTFNAAVQAIQLGTVPAVGERLRVAGWGATTRAGTRPSDILKWHAGTRVRDGLCGTRAGEFCGNGATPLEQACFGDSGGPVFYPNGNTWLLAGAVQEGARPSTRRDACTKGLAIYAVVDNDWVRRTTAPPPPPAPFRTITLRVTARGAQVSGPGPSCYYGDTCMYEVREGTTVSFASTVAGFTPSDCDEGSSSYICKVKVQRDRTIFLKPRSGGIGPGDGPIP